MGDRGAGPAAVAWLGAGPVGLPQPEPGGRAVGYGVCGAIAAVAEHQPLADHDVWRVTLAYEPYGRLVGRVTDGPWQLLQLDDLSDDQLIMLDVALSPLSGAA